MRALTTLSGGTLNAPNGVSIATGCNLVGTGTVNGKIAAGFGCTINATGNLALGNAASPVGFVSNGELYTNANSVTVNDGSQATLGSLTQLGSSGRSGTLNISNGLVVNLGESLVGQGTVNSVNSLANAVVINGNAQGTGSGLVFTGYVKGTGTFSGPVTFAGTYSPDLSSASVQLEQMTLAPASTLVMEVGGLTSGGSSYLNVTGNVNLASTRNDITLNLLGSELTTGTYPLIGYGSLTGCAEFGVRHWQRPQFARRRRDRLFQRFRAQSGRSGGLEPKQRD